MENLLRDFLRCIESLKKELIFQESRGEKWVLAHGFCGDSSASKAESNGGKKTLEIPPAPLKQPGPIKNNSPLSERTTPPTQTEEKAPPAFVFPLRTKPCSIVFVRLCPSVQEKESGIPYSDEGALLLDKIISAMKWNPDHVYKTYLSASVPDSFSEEQFSECRQKLLAQMRDIRPKIMIAWGERVSQVLCDIKKNLENLHETFIPHPMGFLIMPSWDPLYLIKRPEYKKIVWDDLKKIAQCLK